MSQPGTTQTTVTTTRPAAAALALPVYAVTIFLSAFLLFAVQPMFTKMVTPVLGGTPAVWSIAMVFFQAVLLAGYGYAHVLTRHVDPRGAAGIHVGLMIVVMVIALPIAFDASWGAPPAEGQAFWLIMVFAVSVGLPFFAVSANGPLLQAWFAKTGHPHANDPYFLYGASNLGSFLALLAYPFLIEPGLTLAGQSNAWTNGFYALAITIVACAIFLRPAAAPTSPEVIATTTDAPAVTWTDRANWIGLSLVPSALLVATTAHLSTDVAAVPLLWVMPLALFLLTFSLAFRSGGDGFDRFCLRAQPLLLAGILGAKLALGAVPFYVLVLAYLAFFFVTVMICHRALYARRPHVSHLTQFYFFMSAGGVVGGALASLAAPMLFDTVLEFPLLIVIAILCRPDVRTALGGIAPAKLALAAFAAVLALVLIDRGIITVGAVPVLVGLVTMLVLLALIGLSADRPLRLAGATAAAVIAGQAMGSTGNVIERTRSFFAVHAVTETPNGQGRYLAHGTTIHGAERWTDAAGTPLAGRPQPASYFHVGGSYEAAINAARSAQGGTLGKVAVIGLGMGSLACHSKPGEAWSFYEIDAEVVRIARDTSLFRSFTECAPGAPVVLGDGRLTLQDAAGGYDLIVLDAFSSDAVPVHLLTREAVAMYASKLSPDGALVFNISNRHMALAHVVAGSAREAGLVTFDRADQFSGEAFLEDLKSPVHVAIAAREEGHLHTIPREDTWRRTSIPEDFRVWTDDFSNILDPLMRKHAK